MMSDDLLVRRALKAVQEPKPQAAVGRHPNGDAAGIVVSQRVEPQVIIEIHELTRCKLNEALRLFVFAARRAKRGASDADLAYTVRSWLRKDAA